MSLPARFRLGLSHLNEHRFNHNFQNFITPLCTCSLKVDSTSHFFLHFLHYTDVHANLFDELKSVDKNILKLSDNKLINLLFYGNPQLGFNTNTRLLAVASKYIIDSGKFTVPLVWYIRMSLSPLFHLLIFLLENMIESFITLFSFYLLCLTKIQYDLCLINRAE